MPVKFFVSKDSSGKEWPPDNSHEALAAIDICRKLWKAFERQEKLYVVLANLHHPSADLVIISEHGMGIVELKHYFGRISTTSEGFWYAGKVRMQSGTTGAINPHEQVQKYADELRRLLINPAPGNKWLSGRVADWPEYKFETAVCFTHPDVIIDSFRDYVRRSSCLNTKKWEEFSILIPNDIPSWAASLRFEVRKGQENDYEPYKLSPSSILKIAQELFRGKEWTEIINLMPNEQPYAYIALLENGRRVAIFGLDRDEVVVGRDVQNCHVAVPEQYGKASRKHCRIVRSVEGIFIEDINSRNGTYIDGALLSGKLPLSKRTQITLGGPQTGEKVCLLEFFYQEEEEFNNIINRSTEQKTTTA